MTQSRIAVTIAVLAVLASGAGIAFNFARDPYTASRAQLEERLKEVSTPPESLEGTFKADYAKWKKTVEGRLPLWDSLVPPPVKVAAPPDPTKEMEGIGLLPGSSGGVGPNAKVRLSTPSNTRGRMFKAGDAITPTVTLQEIAADKIIFKVQVGAQSVSHSIPRG